MIVYVESNFVLEIALEQEQISAAYAILTLAENGKIKLAIPSFALSEPFECIMRERRERNGLRLSLVKALSNLERSEPHKQIIRDLKPIVDILKVAHVRQLDLLHTTFNKLLIVGECIECNAACFIEALQYQKSLDLSPQDSMIYSTMVADLKRRPQSEIKCFLSRDKRAFDSKHAIRTEQDANNCRYIGNFHQGLDFIQHALQAAE
jgi:hypothetical protein